MSYQTEHLTKCNRILSIMKFLINLQLALLVHRKLYKNFGGRISRLLTFLEYLIIIITKI